MDIREQAIQNAAAAHQAAGTPSGCKACQRTGIPVFPLRVAVVPGPTVSTHWQPSVPAQGVTLSSDFKYALRTLRMGYLYVLLDRAVWQAYAVTADGCMRQFNPYEMPESLVVDPLSEACRTVGHDVIASFISLDDKRYSEAWLAFSSDPWSRKVLDGYKNALRPDGRFIKISLAELKNSPRSIPGALPLDHSLTSLKSNVAEFATEFFPDTARIGESVSGSVHGFYPRLRAEKQRKMVGHIISMGERYGCSIVALPLPDATGIVQELNNARMQIAEASQAYLNEPGVFHRHMISEAITDNLARIKREIAGAARPRFNVDPSMYVLAGPSFGQSPEMVSKEAVAEQTFAEQYARLMKSYDEPARARFAQQFEQHFTALQAQLSAVDEDLAAWYRSAAWLTSVNNDYSPESCVYSRVAQTCTLAVCLQGGAMGKATDQVWLDTFLTSGDSPAYTGFVGTDLAQINNIFNFGNFKTALTSDEFGNALKSPVVQRAMVSRMMAVSGSVSRLWKELTETQRRGSAWMIQAAMQSAGKPTLVLQYWSTLDRLQQRYNSAGVSADSAGKGGASAAAAGAVMALQGGAEKTPVMMTLVVPGTPEMLRQSMPEGTTALRASADVELHALTVSPLSLAGRENTGVVMQASDAQLAKYREQGQRMVSGDSVGLILGAGLMAIQIYGWHTLKDRLSRAVGNEVDVTADVTVSTLLLMEGFSEMVGFASKLAVKQNWLVLSKVAQVPMPVRFGGVLGGIAGIVEGIRSRTNSRNAMKNGDKDAADNYQRAEFAYISGGLIAIVFSALGSFTLTGSFLLGPAGWAGLLLLAGSVLATQGSALRSTPFEIWLRRTCFGIRNESIHALPVWRVESQKDLADALADYQAIISGMVADVAFGGTTTIQAVSYERVEFRIALPGWSSNKGGWSVTVTGGDNNVLFSESHGAPGLRDHRQALRASDYYPGTYNQNIDGGNLVIKGSVWVAQSRVPDVTMVAEYWPNGADPHARMALTVKAEPSWVNSDTTAQWSVK